MRILRSTELTSSTSISSLFHHFCTVREFLRRGTKTQSERPIETDSQRPPVSVHAELFNLVLPLTLRIYVEF